MNTNINLLISFSQRKGGRLTKEPTGKPSYRGGIRGKIQDVLTECWSFQDSCWSFSLCHSRSHTLVRTHTPLPLSFLASDSRHPAMTWGVSLAASKAALNRQKYLLWQTDRPSATTPYMQLSPSLPLPFPTLWFDSPSRSFSLSGPSGSSLVFLPFLQLLYTMLKSYTYTEDIVFGSVWLVARNGGVEGGGVRRSFGFHKANCWACGHRALGQCRPAQV